MKAVRFKCHLKKSNLINIIFLKNNKRLTKTYYYILNIKNNVK